MVETAYSHTESASIFAQCGMMDAAFPSQSAAKVRHRSGYSHAAVDHDVLARHEIGIAGEKLNGPRHTATRADASDRILRAIDVVQFHGL